MADFFSAQNRIKKQVKGAMVYPATILVVAVGIISFLLTVVVPQITQIFEDTGQELPAITRFVLDASDFLKAHYIALALGIIALIVLFKLAYSLLGPFRRFIDRRLLRLPMFGPLIANHELGRFSYILSLMLQSGVAYAPAVELSKATFHNTALRRRFEHASTKVQEGNKLSSALATTPGAHIKRNFLQALALGEESSEVSQVLSNLAALYREENEDRIKILLSLMNPLMMLFIGGFVGIIIAAMMLPIMTMSQGLQ